LLVNKNSNGNKDVIEVDITLKTKDRNTFIKSCLIGELDRLNKQEFNEHVTTNINPEDFKNNQLIYAPPGTGKITLLVLEALHKLLVSESHNFIFFLSPSTDRIRMNVI
jgi:hypothetical protein